MKTITIRRLAFNSYIEISGIIGFLMGLISTIMNLISSIFNVMGNSDINLAALLIILIVTPIVSGLGGLIAGVVTYYPYKIYTDFKKETTLKVIINE